MWRRELLFVVLIVFVVFIVIEVVVIIQVILVVLFLDVVFVGVNFRGALWTAKHRPILRVNVRPTEPRAWRAATSSVLYTATPGRPLIGASRSSLTQQTGIMTRQDQRLGRGR